MAAPATMGAGAAAGRGRADVSGVSTPVVGVGIIGCGDIGALRAAALARVPGGRLVAVSDLDAERARALTARFEAGVVADWRALVARDDVEVVLVCTPPHLHAEMS